MPDRKPDELLTPKQAAELWNCTPRTIENWRNRGYIKAVRTPSGLFRYKKSDIIRAMDLYDDQSFNTRGRARIDNDPAMG